jgi:hypothetical protein
MHSHCGTEVRQKFRSKEERKRGKIKEPITADTDSFDVIPNTLSKIESKKKIRSSTTIPMRIFQAVYSDCRYTFRS